jgi:hypothetical protein
MLSALIQNGAAMPDAAMMTPASAGPIARLTLRPMLLRATMDAKSLPRVKMPNRDNFFPEFPRLMP